MTPAAARSELITLLQMAYSGERAAAYAYLGHRRSLDRTRRARDNEMLRGILVDEIRHRRIVRRLLDSLNACGDPRREHKMSPHWSRPTQRTAIRTSFADFVTTGEPEPTLRWTPLR